MSSLALLKDHFEEALLRRHTLFTELANAPTGTDFAISASSGFVPQLCHSLIFRERPVLVEAAVEVVTHL